MALRTIFSHVLDTLNLGAGNDKFTGVTVTGTGAQAADAVTLHEGAASFRNYSTSGAGTAYGSKTIANCTIGCYRHVHAWMMLNNDTTPATAPANWTMPSSSVQLLNITDSATNKGIFVSQNSVAGATTGWIFTLTANTTAPSTNDNTVDGVTAGTWVEVDLYWFIHATAGWAQLWFDGAMVAEITGIDTYEADYNRLRAGIIAKGDATQVGCVWWDDLTLDDELSPVPPTGVSWWTANIPADTSPGDINDEFSASTIGAGGAIDCSIAGRTTNCLQTSASGVAGQNAQGHKIIQTFASGTYLHIVDYIKIDVDADPSTMFVSLFILVNDATDTNICVGYLTPSSGGSHTVRVSDHITGGTNWDSASMFDLDDDYRKYELWLYNHASAGKIRLEIDGALAVYATGLNTIHNGSNDRISVGIASTDASAKTAEHDDIVVDADAYAGWSMSTGTPLRRRIVAPSLNPAGNTALGYVGYA